MARGDQVAFEAVYDRTAGQVLGVIRGVVRDPAQSGEVMEEVLVDVWRSASRYGQARGGAAAWLLPLAHARGCPGQIGAKISRTGDACCIAADPL